jgi:ElaB/YqjD/DUF883 family membrane-anchored ribosome-binding protein
MTTSPDQIRLEIERTRSDLSSNVNALGDKVNPGSIAKRQGERVRGAASNVKDAVMGSADDAKSATSNAPGAVARRAQGSPIAAGLIAFGAGMLMSSLLPASRVEQQAAEAVKQQAEPLVSEITDAAKEAAGNLKEPAHQAIDSVKDTAADAVDTVKDESASAANDVKDQAQDAKQNVQETAS